MKSIRHVSYANVAATVALVFAMSGGALAASHYVIDSSKQINPRVLRQFNGRTGASGKTGARGQAGETGAAGATGPAGARGAQGDPGSPGSAAGFAYVNSNGDVLTRGGAVVIE